MKINIAIDGPSAAGKSTIAKLLAKDLDYVHLDTGAMYRCVGYSALLNGIDLDNELEIEKMMGNINISFDSKGNVYINDNDVSKEIRQNKVSMVTSKISAYPKVRKLLVEQQQELAKVKGYIMDGRDIGTIVLPDAELKIYMVASVKARADRRYKEYIEKDIAADYDEIYRDIEQRDYQDINRKTSPLRQADDAIKLDTSDMTIDEVVTAIRKLIKEKL